jgi:hypothetical protein
MAFHALPASSATPFDAIAASPDITIDLAGTTTNDEDVAEDDFGMTVPTTGPPGIPQSADLDAYHRLIDDDLFSLDTTVTLPGGLTAGPEDVVRWDGAAYSLEFDGSANGIPSGARVDAVSVEGLSGDLILSFDISVDLGGLTADDEDLVAFDGLSFSSFFDASAAGVPGSLDLDAVHHIDANGNLAVSFDTSAMVGGITFDDEDVLEYDVGGDSWELVFDGSAEHADWEPADLDSVHLIMPVPEPSILAGLVTGVALLTVLRRRSLLNRA